MEALAWQLQQQQQQHQQQQQQQWQQQWPQQQQAAPQQQPGNTKCAVLVRGYDYATTSQQIASYMSGAGTVVNIQMFTSKGSACVTYSSPAEAQAAVQGFNQTVIPGNTRYLDVLPMDPEEFLARHNIDEDKRLEFMAMPSDQQQAVMARGGLATARDPNAVLATRMKQITGTGGFEKGGGKGSYPAPAMPTLGGSDEAKCCVLVRGYDFGTTDETLLGYMSGAGPITNHQKIDDGSACITYSSPIEAQAAVQVLNQTIIPGNSRYLDVSGMDPEQFIAGYGIDQDMQMRFMALTPKQQVAVMTKGSLASARDPNAVLATRLKQISGAGGTYAGQVANSSNTIANLGSSSMGKCVVLVRGYDFGTTEDTITAYMSGAGSVTKFQTIDSGSACVTYSTQQEAQAAVQFFNQTNIPGNTRYLDVSSMDQEQFLAGSNVDMALRMQFNGMSPEQKAAVMAKGSLSTARDPNSVLATRMGQVGATGGGGKGSFGPAQGCGGKGGAGKGPYGGGGSGQGGEGDNMGMLLEVARLLKQLAGNNSGGDWGSSGSNSDWGSGDGDWGSGGGSNWW